MATTESSSSSYPGWVFRLNIPKANTNDGDEAKNDLPSSVVGVDESESVDEGMELLPRKSHGLLPTSSVPPASLPPSSKYLAELCQHGVSVATLSDPTLSDPDADVARPERDELKWSWSYSSESSPSQWNVTSSRLLSVTYRPAHEAYPSYTNISKKREYWHKSVGSCCGLTGKARRRRKHRWGKMRRKITGAPKPIHRVKVSYTVEDVLSMEPIVATSSSFAVDDINDDGGDCVWIRGVGKCHALRVYLRPKFGSCDGKGNANISEKQDILEGSHGYDLPDADKWDSLPSPPWDEMDTADKKNVKHWGPVITFAIPCQDGNSESKTAWHKCPPLLWKVDHPPNSNVAIDSLLLMDGALHVHQNPNENSSSSSYDYDTPTNVYINGYQSWSFSGSVVQGKDQPKSAMPDVFSAAFNRGGIVLTGDDIQSGADFDGDHWNDNMKAPVDSGVAQDSEYEDLDESSAFYKSDMFACISSNGATTSYGDDRILLDEEGGPALIVGFLSQRQQYGAVLLDKDLRQFNLYACHEGVVAKRGIESDWAYCQIVDANTYDEEAMVYYVHASGDHNDARPMEKGLTCGWCSWYHYYNDIDHDSLSKNAHVLQKSMDVLGFNLCLIDDGYMTAWGDWTSLKPGKFVKEGGMRVLSDAIRTKGMKPGVWLAPFACDKNSKLAQDHPDWIIRNDFGRHANSANCGKFFYGLDATNPAVRKHVYDTIHRAVSEWGFDVLKLDFLYASCLEGNGKYDPTMSRAEAMNLGLRTIRAAAGSDTFIIGCGCPIGSAVGFVDGMRVSCDTGPTFVPEFPFPKHDNGTLPALKGMLRNTMSRSPLGHRWWHNDPDCLLLGAQTRLTNDEVVSAATIVAMTGGMFLLSDDMEKVSAERLDIAKRIFPLTGITGVPLDLHSTVLEGMPSVVRLWCTEKSSSGDQSSANDIDIVNAESSDSNPGKILRGQASKLEVEVGHYSAGFNGDPYSRERSCFSVARGLGSWTVVSMSNWLDSAKTMSLSFSALVNHSIEDFVATGAPRSARSLTASATPGETAEQHGFHVFSFWSSEYVWISHQILASNNPLIKKLKPHESEILHIKPADPSRPQYIGSDLHFSCGFEVLSFRWSDRQVIIQLKNEYKRKGSIFIYLPGEKVLENSTATVNGKSVAKEIVARPSIGSSPGSVLRVDVQIEGSRGESDGLVSITW